MNKRQKENVSSNKPRLAINIITPIDVDKPVEKLAFSQALHEEY
jgi:hypothetical protein